MTGVGRMMEVLRVERASTVWASLVVALAILARKRKVMAKARKTCVELVSFIVTPS